MFLVLIIYRDIFQKVVQTFTIISATLEKPLMPMHLALNLSWNRLLSRRAIAKKHKEGGSIEFQKEFPDSGPSIKATGYRKAMTYCKGQQNPMDHFTAE